MKTLQRKAKINSRNFIFKKKQLPLYRKNQDGGCFYLKKNIENLLNKIEGMSNPRNVKHFKISKKKKKSQGTSQLKIRVNIWITLNKMINNRYILCCKDIDL